MRNRTSGRVHLPALTRVLTLTLFVATTAISATAVAGFWSGQVLITKLTRCDNFSGVSATECSEGMGYIKGVADMLGIEEAKQACGHTIKYSTLERVVINWLKANQPRWEEPAEQLVKAAIDEEWPCPP